MGSADGRGYVPTFRGRPHRPALVSTAVLRVELSEGRPGALAVVHPAGGSVHPQVRMARGLTRLTGTEGPFVHKQDVAPARVRRCR